MKKLLAPIVSIALLSFVSCAKKTSSPGSASEPPKPKATAYTTDVLPLLQAKCSPCHFPSKGGNKANFETYASAAKFGAEILVRIQKNPGERGYMPMRNPKLADTEISLVKKWIDGGMAEN